MGRLKPTWMVRVFWVLSIWAVLFAATPPCALAREPQYLSIHMRSAVLSAFWGRSVGFEAHVLLPDSYYQEPQRHFPIIYWIPGFDGTSDISTVDEAQWQTPMRQLHEQFIVVSIDGMFDGGHDEFADSANNGPWGTALTTEFIPATEAQFRAIGAPTTRFVAGHSSGGWSALWLQVTYPDIFGGEWSLSPDPVDFRDFTGPDLTKSPPQNFFEDSTGRDYTIAGLRLRDFVVAPDWRKRQFDSFDAVFSPRGVDGKPVPLFDRRTGTIDPIVAAYWEKHYDIARILRDDWPDLAPRLRGKLHIIVGSDDTFGLQIPVELLAGELHDLGSDAKIIEVPGANHFSIFEWRGSALSEIIREATASLGTSNTASSK